MTGIFDVRPEKVELDWEQVGKALNDPEVIREDIASLDEDVLSWRQGIARSRESIDRDEAHIAECVRDLETAGRRRLKLLYRLLEVLAEEERSDAVLRAQDRGKA